MLHWMMFLPVTFRLKYGNRVPVRIMRSSQYGDAYTDRIGRSNIGYGNSMVFIVAVREWLIIVEELDYLDGAVSNPKRPFAALVGDSKAQGLSVGSSLVEEDKLDLATTLLDKAKAKSVSLLLPTDMVIADKFAPASNSINAKSTDISKITRKPPKTSKHGHGERKSTKEARDAKPKPGKVKKSKLWSTFSQIGQTSDKLELVAANLSLCFCFAEAIEAKSKLLEAAKLHVHIGLNTYLGKINTRVPISSYELSTLNSASNVILEGNWVSHR
ncbi:3-phosphoglycerate kinase [Tanacetum coccineum]